MNWTALIALVTGSIAAFGSAGWLAHDRERTRLERDAELYERALPDRAKEELAQAIDYRAYAIRRREADRSVAGTFANGFALSIYGALLTYAGWRLSVAVTARNVGVAIIAALAPIIYFGIKAVRDDLRGHRYREEFVELD